MGRGSNGGAWLPLSDKAWLRAVGATAATTGASRAAVMLGVAHALATGPGPRVDVRALRLAALADGNAAVSVPPPPPASPVSDLAGRCYESLLGAGERRSAGAHYTPARLAGRLTAIALKGMAGDPTVCDPACGGGAFLLAAARSLHAAGRPRATIVQRLLWGFDIDPLAIAVCELALALWSGATPGAHLAATDGLSVVSAGWAPPGGGFDAVVGNPPFQSQLRRGTARSADTTAALRPTYGDALGAYADTAALFLLAGTRLARPGGRVVLVQPMSVLSSRDAAGARRAVLRAATLEGLWVAGERVFAAATNVCAPVLRVVTARPSPTPSRAPSPAPSRAPSRGVALWSGRDVEPRPPVAVLDREVRGWATWSVLAAAAAGVPDVAPDPVHGRIGDVATATAGFRQHFYGLAGAVVDRRVADDRREPRLVTCGLLDVGWCAWGTRPGRLAGRSYDAPRVDLDALGAVETSSVARWVQARTVPKVVVATQTRIVEAAVDVDGIWVPSTPVISVEPVDPASDSLWRLGAVLLAPPVSAWALRTYGGVALGSDRIKLAARQVLDVPLPGCSASWDEAAGGLRRLAVEPDARARRQGLLAIGAAMTAAYGCGGDVLEWWQGRLPGVAG